MGILGLTDIESVRAYSQFAEVLAAEDSVLQTQIDTAEALIYAQAPTGYKTDARSVATLKIAANMLAERLLVSSNPETTAAKLQGIKKEQTGSYSYERDMKDADPLSGTIRALLSACVADDGVISIFVQPVYTKQILADEQFQRLRDGF